MMRDLCKHLWFYFAKFFNLWHANDVINLAPKFCFSISQLFAEGEVNIGEYLSGRSRGKYSAIFTEHEVNNCFGIIFRGEYKELEEN